MLAQICSLVFLTHPPIATMTAAQLGQGAPGEAGSGDFTLQDFDRPTEPLEDPQSIIDIAKQIDPEQGQKLQQDFDDQKIGLVVFVHPNPAAYGYHDWNTVGVNKGSNDALMAIGLLHEYTHTTYSYPGDPATPGTGHDSRHGSACYDCTHADMTAKSWTQLFKLVCEDLSIDPTEAYKLCVALDALQADALDLHQDCDPAVCSSKKPWDELANWQDPCLLCDGGY